MGQTLELGCRWVPHSIPNNQQNRIVFANSQIHANDTAKTTKTGCNEVYGSHHRQHSTTNSRLSYHEDHIHIHIYIYGDKIKPGLKVGAEHHAFVGIGKWCRRVLLASTKQILSKRASASPLRVTDGKPTYGAYCEGITNANSVRARLGARFEFN